MDGNTLKWCMECREFVFPKHRVDTFPDFVGGGSFSWLECPICGEGAIDEVDACPICEGPKSEREDLCPICTEGIARDVYELLEKWRGYDGDLEPAKYAVSVVIND